MFTNRQVIISFVRSLWRSRWPDLVGWLVLALIALGLLALFVDYWHYRTSLDSFQNGDIPVTVSPLQKGDMRATVSPTQKGDIRVTVTGSPTALCDDGSYSYAAHHQGACSDHNGVRQWLK